MQFLWLLHLNKIFKMMKFKVDTEDDLIQNDLYENFWWSSSRWCHWPTTNHWLSRDFSQTICQSESSLISLFTWCLCFVAIYLMFVFCFICLCLCCSFCLFDKTCFSFFVVLDLVCYLDSNWKRNFRLGFYSTILMSPCLFVSCCNNLIPSLGKSQWRKNWGEKTLS